jgi:putative membrane protein insertion efficiency factor
MLHPSWRMRAATGLLAVAALFLFDVSRAPSAQWTAAAAVGAIHLYQRTLGAVMPSLGVRCRFAPTCSHYAVAVIERHGLVGGAWRAGKRLARCGPWTPVGTVDPPT